MGQMDQEPAAELQHVPAAEPVPALVNAVLLGIAQAYIPQLRAIDADNLETQIWTGQPHLIFVPEEQLPAESARHSDEDGNALALGTVAFGIQDTQTGADTYRIFLNVVPYSEQNIEIALAADALAHAMGACQSDDECPVQTYSLWFTVGAPEDRLSAPEMYVIGANGIDDADEFTADGDWATTIVAFTDAWPPSTEQQRELRFWNFLNELAERIVVSLIDEQEDS